MKEMINQSRKYNVCGNKVELKVTNSLTYGDNFLR